MADWYRTHAANLIDVLTEREAETVAWTMDPGDQTVGFWRRRQVHDIDDNFVLGSGKLVDAVDLAAPAEVLLRLLWHRSTDDGVTDEQRHLVSGALTP